MRVFWLFLLCFLVAQAQPIQVASAANLTMALKAIRTRFLLDHPKAQIKLSFGSSGKLYTQITQGAPFDLFISADQERPLKLKEEKYTPYEVKVYAKGVLVLWSATRKVESLDILKGSFNHLSIANPHLAPYGRASMEVLKNLGLDQELKSKIVQANSISQANQYAASKGADLGFSALSLMDLKNTQHYLIVPPHLYTPIKQAMVLTNQGGHNKLAKEFEAFILGPEGKKILKAYGYLIEGL
nr:molybdate ABC transporter substrate-binding protein [Helicobacter bizzozeronii]